jgi:3-methylfumaryl-CoA hydratase
VTSFGYRLSSPVFSGSTVLTHGRREDDGLALSGMVEGGARAITGRVTFAQ